MAKFLPAPTLGWSRENIRKGEQDLATGIDNQDNFHLRGRKRSEHHRPELLNDLKAIVEPRSQTDPTFRSIRNDFGGRERHTPFGVFFPETKEQYFWMATNKVTADFMVDRLEEIIPKLLEKCPQMKTLVMNADNGCHSSLVCFFSESEPFRTSSRQLKRAVKAY